MHITLAWLCCLFGLHNDKNMQICFLWKKKTNAVNFLLSRYSSILLQHIITEMMTFDTSKWAYFLCKLGPFCIDLNQPSNLKVITIYNTSIQMDWYFILFHTDWQTDAWPSATRTQSIVTTLSTLNPPMCDPAAIDAKSNVKWPNPRRLFPLTEGDGGVHYCHRRQATAEQVQCHTEKGGGDREERASS